MGGMVGDLSPHPLRTSHDSDNAVCCSHTPLPPLILHPSLLPPSFSLCLFLSLSFPFIFYFLILSLSRSLSAVHVSAMQMISGPDWAWVLLVSAMQQVGCCVLECDMGAILNHNPGIPLTVYTNTKPRRSARPPSFTKGEGEEWRGGEER